jgi:hypothetical protein
LEEYPYLNELINSLLYRLRLSEALQLEKSLKVSQLTQEIAALQRENSDLVKGNTFLSE